MSSEREADSVESFTATEQKIAAIWKDALSLCELPRPHDNFFALGGDSVSMIMAELRVKEELEINIPAGAMLGRPSLRTFCAFLDECVGVNAHS